MYSLTKSITNMKQNKLTDQIKYFVFQPSVSTPGVFVDVLVMIFKTRRSNIIILHLVQTEARQDEYQQLIYIIVCEYCGTICG